MKQRVKVISAFRHHKLEIYINLLKVINAQKFVVSKYLDVGLNDCLVVADALDVEEFVLFFVHNNSVDELPPLLCGVRGVKNLH